jgi:sulfoxide reductase heme-binding subunit YedZ
MREWIFRGITNGRSRVLSSAKEANQRRLLLWRWARFALFCASLVPFICLLVGIVDNSLGADPARSLSLETGRWSIQFLLLSLAITPVRELLKLPHLAPLRRTFGLFSLFYATLHVTVYVIFLLEMRWSEIGSDILERPYITVGFASFVILLVLGVTSPKSVVRLLGRKWKLIHRFVYLAIILAIVHVIWILRTDVFDAVVYAVAATLLFAYRLSRWMGNRRRI